ncbi:MAG: cysteine desulfurase [Bacteroidetes bacterium]|nr:MAG: cysteine desulfurase [Bacteroidota bacterium]
MSRIYFDNAATTPIDPEVQKEMLEAMQNLYGNASSIHAEGRMARAALEQARKKVANYLGASIGEIFFTSGGSESNNMVLKGAVRDLGVQRIISTPVEHHCNLHSFEAIKRDWPEVEIILLSIDEKGLPDLGQLKETLNDQSKKTLVSLMHSNNETGSMVDLEAIAEMCDEAGVLFHSDTVQTIGYFPFDLSKTRISFISGSAHKFYGPKGSGFVYINNENIVKPMIDGGGQERNMRAGTESIHNILGLAKAMELAYDNLEERKNHVEDLRAYMIQELLKEFDDIHFNGPETGGHYKVLSVSFPPSPRAELLLLNLDIAGISVSGGSACTSGADAGSHVMEAIHGDSPRKTIRFSFSHHNTREEVDIVMEKLKEILE